MSLVLNMVGGGGGGGISGNTAVLEVVAPVGSSVSITDGVITKTQTSADSHPVSDRQTVAAYIFPVGSDEFGTWTITATRGTETNTTTVTISAIMDYVVYVGYHVPIGQYQEVEYITFPSGSYINTNVSANVETDGIFTEAKFSETSYGNDRHYIGVDQSYGETYQVTTYNNKYYIGSGSGEANGGSWASGIKVLEYNDKSRNYGLYVNGTVTVSGNKAPQPSLAIFIGRRGSATNFVGNVYYIKLKGNTSGNYLREMYPCYRLSDSKAGFYDKINGVFYTNSGSGTFSVGADV